MSKVFQFGERLPAYDVPVLNERELRAGAGILFLIAMVAFLKAWYLGDFALTRIVVIGFFVEFFIRVIVNPTYAPSLVLGRLFVRNQLPDYVGAPQKRFAWAIGLALASLMIYLVVLHDVRGPINLLVCLACLIFLFFESAFGICIGCAVYNLFNKDKAQLCPGGVCEIHPRHDSQRVGLVQLGVLAGFIGLMAAVIMVMPSASQPRRQTANAGTASGSDDERCRVPAFAIAIGHVDRWKLHNNCP